MEAVVMPTDVDSVPDPETIPCTRPDSMRRLVCFINPVVFVGLSFIVGGMVMAGLGLTDAPMYYPLAFIGVSLATLGLCLVCLGVWDLCSCCCRSGRSDTSVPPGELHPVGDVSPMPSPPPAYSSLFTFRPSVTSVTGNVPDMCVPSSSANPDNVILLPVTYIRCEDRRGSHHLTCSCASPTPSMDDRPPKYEDAFCD
ncbi:uncharacterized protein LOC118409882 [Branchiostoma floridae]|uniref:Uncharacterized protein LOC118409882 n=1 Tax=Branchiostoma floridae TaxID=7739 RepID=A0A9J7KNA0_BRAFL|nr:uncharacterized protein LOC118409882 [Branchiostoma floridae]